MSHPRHHPRDTASSPDADRVKLRLRLPTDGSVDLDQLRASLEAHLQRSAPPEIVEPVVQPELVAERDTTRGGKVESVILFAGIALAVVVSGTGIGLVVYGETSMAGVGWFLLVVGIALLVVGITLVVHQKRKVAAEPVEELPEPEIIAEPPPFLVWQWLRQHSKAVVAVATIPVVAILVIALMGRETEPAGKTGIAGQPDPVEQTEPAGKTDLSWVLAVAGSGVGLAFFGVGGWLVWRRIRKAKEAGVEAETEPAEEPFSFRRLIKSYPYLSATIGLVVASLGLGLGVYVLGAGVFRSLILSATICILGLETLFLAKLLALYRNRVFEKVGAVVGGKDLPIPWMFLCLAAFLHAFIVGTAIASNLPFLVGVIGVGALGVLGLPLLAVPTAWSLYRARTAEERRDAESAEPITLWEHIFGEPLDEETGLGRTVAWVKTNPKKTAGAAVAAVVLFGGLIVALFYGISSIPTETAQDDPKPEPPVESSETFRPAEGYEGRLAAVLIAGGLLGYGGFQLRRKVAKAFPTPEVRQTAANAVFVDFWPGFRHFVAAQGGFLLVAGAIGMGCVLWMLPSITAELSLTNYADSLRLHENLSNEEPDWLNDQETGGSGLWRRELIFKAVLWTLFVGLPVSAMLVMALGAVGINLMPKLDREVMPAADGSSASRFAKRKVWHIVLIGLILGTMISVWRVEPIHHWWHLWLKWTLSLGLVAAAFWGKGELGGKVKNVQPLPIKTQAKLDHVMAFNLPLLVGLALLMALGLLVLTGFSWLNIGWLAPSAALTIFLVMGLLMKYPRLLRHWLEIIFFPAIVAFICDLIVGDGYYTFWFVFGGLSAAFAYGYVVIEGKNSTKHSGRLLIFPPRDRVYRPVRTWEKDSMKIRWSGLIAVAAFILLTLAAAGKWVWSGTP